ncbi:MAG: CRISPR system precrRNA processing endoribonuclease RAMP protein Cas6 [bacterium]|nr:CRISPR system precrRNA processing endoribonuclease RAMP protein Cas6 [bacterium]
MENDTKIDFTPTWKRVVVRCEFREPHGFDFVIPMLRGALGYSLRETYCRNRLGRCGECEQTAECLYFRIFEAFKSPPLHPFQFSMLDYPVENNKELWFYLTLLQQEINLLPVFVKELENIGRLGLGRDSIKIVSLKIVDPGNHQVYLANDERRGPPEYSFHDIRRMATHGPPGRTKLKFLTPLQLKIDGKFAERFEFTDIIKAVARRLNLMERCYGTSNRIAADQLLEAGGTVETVASNLRYVRHSRYSTRKKERMPLNGVVGEMVVEGDVERFLPLLLLGETFHVGAKTTFGLGQYVTYLLE